MVFGGREKSAVNRGFTIHCFPHQIRRQMNWTRFGLVFVDNRRVNVKPEDACWMVQGQLPGPTAKSTLMVSIFILTNKYSKCSLNLFDVKGGGFEA